MVAPWETDLRPIPDDLVSWHHANNKQRIGKEAMMLTRQDVSEPTFDENWSIPVDLQAATALAQDLVLELNDLESRFYKQEGNSLYFKMGRARSCPYSRGHKGDTHKTNNFSLKFRLDGTITHFCYGADCHKEYEESPAVIGNWKHNSTSVTPSSQSPPNLLEVLVLPDEAVEAAENADTQLIPSLQHLPNIAATGHILRRGMCVCEREGTLRGLQNLG